MQYAECSIHKIKVNSLYTMYIYTNDLIVHLMIIKQAMKHRCIYIAMLIMTSRSAHIDYIHIEKYRQTKLHNANGTFQCN